MSDDVILDMVQGADWALEVQWTDADQNPFKVLSPMRMEIRNSTGQVLATLQTDDSAGETDPVTILYNSDSGLIQLMLPSTTTNTFAPGSYSYDLFVTYQDNEVTNTTRLHRLIAGQIVVDKRITKNV